MDAGRLIGKSTNTSKRSTSSKQRKSPPAVKATTCELCRNWPKAMAIGARGVALTHAELLGQEILPCFPNMDIGFDLVSVHKNILKRIQVKATESLKVVNGESISFCLSRHKTGMSRDGVYTRAPHRPYDHADVDVFVFVHNLLRKFYVVPAHVIDLSRHKISFRSDSPWADAWYVLTQP